MVDQRPVRKRTTVLVLHDKEATVYSPEDQSKPGLYQCVCAADRRQCSLRVVTQTIIADP